jgi:hypothetical protein
VEPEVLTEAWWGRVREAMASYDADCASWDISSGINPVLTGRQHKIVFRAHASSGGGKLFTSLLEMAPLFADPAASANVVYWEYLKWKAKHQI